MRDGFERARGGAYAGDRHVERGDRLELELAGRPTLEVLVGLVRCRNRIGDRRCRTGADPARRFAGIRRGHLGPAAARRGAAGDAELLLELQVREPPHRFGRHRTRGRLVEVAPIALHREIQRIRDLDLGDIGLDGAQLRERARVGRAGAARDENRG